MFDRALYQRAAEDLRSKAVSGMHTIPLGIAWYSPFPLLLPEQVGETHILVDLSVFGQHSHRHQQPLFEYGL